MTDMSQLGGGPMSFYGDIPIIIIWLVMQNHPYPRINEKRTNMRKRATKYDRKVNLLR
jgi:hypothetical protein